jgi:hypothetical protein
LAKSGDAGEDLLGGLGPDEWLGGFVAGGEIEADGILEPRLRAWEAYFELTDRGFPIAFRFAFGVLRDEAALNPSEPEVIEWAAAASGGFVVRKLEMTPPAPPPDWFSAVPPIMDELRSSWRMVQEGRALTLDRAYWCLTLLEATYGRRARVAATLRVEKRVLDTVGRLTAAEDRARGRKVGGRGPTTIRYEDELWLRAAIPRLILRVAEVELGAPVVADLGMADLPSL